MILLNVVAAFTAKDCLISLEFLFQTTEKTKKGQIMTLVAIGLDSAEPKDVEKLINEDKLPNFKRLIDKGVYGRLENFDVFTAELPWTTFATGVMPENTGYWTPLKYEPDYNVHTRAAYEYDEFPAFYALGKGTRVCSFDVPQVRLQEGLDGLQINAWGAHSPQVEQESNDSKLFQEILDKYREHPGLHKDYAHVLNMKNVRKVYDMLIAGCKLRGEVCADLLKREDWDLFLTVFGEPHGAGHNFWQFRPEHPLFEQSIKDKDLLPEDPLTDTMQEIDTAVGKIMDAAPSDSTFVLFSAHGMGPNTMDLPSTFFLPELMYRMSFKQPALGVETGSDATVIEQSWQNWERHVWNTSSRGGPIVRALRKILPTRLYNKFEPYFEVGHEDFPVNPNTARKMYAPKPWFQTTMWYRHLWKDMEAFALPSFSDGYIRVNLKGREQNGLVEPEDFKNTIKRICDSLNKLTCYRTGVKMVKRIEVMRDTGFETDPKLPDADIVICWQEEYATDCVIHPELGKIGPVPHFRAGSHRHTGFMIASGAKIQKNSTIENGHALDIAPTILSLMGKPIPSYMRGKPITEISQPLEAVS